MLVSSVVVEHDVDQLAGRNLPFDGVQEQDELLMPVPPPVLADDRPVEHVECREQGCGPMALVIAGHRAQSSRLHRKARLRSIDRLNLRLLVDRQHHCVLWRIDIEPHHILDLGGEARVVGQLELPKTMRHQAVLLPDAI